MGGGEGRFCSMPVPICICRQLAYTQWKLSTFHRCPISISYLAFRYAKSLLSRWVVAALGFGAEPRGPHLSTLRKGARESIDLAALVRRAQRAAEQAGSIDDALFRRCSKQLFLVDQVKNHAKYLIRFWNV